MPWAAGLASEGPHQLSTEVTPNESNNVDSTSVDLRDVRAEATRHWFTSRSVKTKAEFTDNKVKDEAKELVTSSPAIETIRPRSGQNATNLRRIEDVRNFRLFDGSLNVESLRSRYEPASIEQSQGSSPIVLQDHLIAKPANRLESGESEIFDSVLVPTSSCVPEAVSAVSFSGRIPAESPDEVLVSAGELSLLEQREAASVETGLQRGEALTPEVCSSLNVEAEPFIPRKLKCSVDSQDGVEHSGLSEVEFGQQPSKEVSKGINAPAVAAVSSQGLPKQAFINGYFEGVKIKFLIDTGAEISIISEETLARFPKTLRVAFQDRTHILVMASGERVLAKGPVLCNITINGHTILEPVCVMSTGPQALLSMPALVALDLELRVAGEAVVMPHKYSKIRRLQTSRVLHVAAAADFVIPPRSQHIITGRIEGRVFNDQEYIVERLNRGASEELLVAHTISGHNKGQTIMRVLNPTDRENTCVRRATVSKR